MKANLHELRADMAGSPELSAHLQRRAHGFDISSDVRNVRVPFGLHGSPAALGERVELRAIRPLVPFRPQHMVLAPDSARDFELVSFTSAGRNQYLDSEPLPLHTFSVDYIKNDQLTELQAWGDDTCAPGMSIKIVVLRVGRRGKRAFRGLLWGLAGAGLAVRPTGPNGSELPPWPTFRGPIAGGHGPGSVRWCPRCGGAVPWPCLRPGHHLPLP